jgi:hypothetical protein
MITLTREEAQRVLDALEEIYWPKEHQAHKEIETLRARLSAPEPEPVAWMNESDIGKTDWKVWAHGKPTATMPLYAAPPQREWQGLTDEEIEQGNKESWVTKQAWESAVWWAEEKLKEKNT